MAGDILFWVLIVLLSLVVGAFALALYWQRQNTADLRNYLTRLRELRRTTGQARQAASGFEPTDPEPFGSIASQLKQQVDLVDSKTVELFKRYAMIQEDIRRISNPSWGTFYRLPIEWYQMTMRVESLKKGIDKAEQTLKATGGLLQDLANQSWKVAGQARQVLEDDLSAARILGDLHASNLRDPALEMAIGETKRWEDALRKEVPAFFIGADESTVLKDADKHTTAQVFRVVSEANPAIQEMLKRSRGWQRLHVALAKSLEALPEAFRQLNTCMTTAETAATHPVNWDASRGPLSGLRQQIERLGDIQKTRTLEQLESERQTAEKLIDRAKSMAAHCEEVTKQHDELVALLATPDIVRGDEWIRGAEKLANQAGEYHSDNWGRALSTQTLKDELKTLAELQQHLSWESASVSIPETQVPDLLEEAQRLARIHQELRPRVASIQARLVEMQASEAQAKEALARTRAILNQAVPLLNSNPVLSEAPAREAGLLRQEVDPLIADLDKPTEGTLERKVQKADLFLRKSDQAANRWLEHLLADLQTKKLALSTKVNTLRDIAMLEDTPVAEAARLVEGIARPAPSPTPGPTVTASPTPTSSNPTTPVQQTVARWTRSILPMREREADKAELSGEGTARREVYSLADAMAEIKLRSEEWQRCVAALHAIEDLEGPILERFDKASNARDSARQLLTRATELMPEQRGWPPTTQVLGGERRNLQELEERWNTMRQEPTKALQLVNSLGALGEEYVSLGSRIRQVVERAQQDQNRILDLEDRFEESRRLWMDQWEALAGNMIAQDEIKVMLEQGDRDYESIRERYLRGSIPYNQTLQNLRMLCQRLDDAQVNLDEEWLIDINGDRYPKYPEP